MEYPGYATGFSVYVSVWVLQVEGGRTGGQNLRRAANALRRDDVPGVRVQTVAAQSGRRAVLPGTGRLHGAWIHRPAGRRLRPVSARIVLQSRRRQLYALSAKHVPGSARRAFVCTVSQKLLHAGRRYAIWRNVWSPRVTDCIEPPYTGWGVWHL